MEGVQMLQYKPTKVSLLGVSSLLQYSTGL